MREKEHCWRWYRWQTLLKEHSQQPLGWSICPFRCCQGCAGVTGRIYGVGMDNFIYRREGLNGRWSQIPGSCCVKDISVKDDIFQHFTYGKLSLHFSATFVTASARSSTDIPGSNCFDKDGLFIIKLFANSLSNFINNGLS